MTNRKVYLYLLVRRKFVVLECIVTNYIVKHGLMVIKSTMKEKNSNYLVSNCPETFYNGQVWLETRDDKYGIELLIRYQHQQISKLEKQINNYTTTIETLNNIIEEEYSDDK